MFTSKRDFAELTIIVAAWYVGLTYLPQWVGTCLDAVCGFTPGEIGLSLAMPLIFLAVTISLEVGRHRQSLGQALSNLGLTRWGWAGIRLALVYVLPLLAFYPVVAWITGTRPTLQPNWEWWALSALIVNGPVEEAMMRGYVFRRLRIGRGFWRSAALSTVFFAGYHLPIILTAGPLIGMIGVLLAIPMGFLTAYVFERGDNTIAGPALLHAVNNGLIFVVVFPADVQPLASAFYMLTGLATATVMLVWAYRSGYGRSMASSRAVPVAGEA